MSWARQRKSIYALVVIIVLVVAVGFPLFTHFYKAPTCFDGKQNGNETGVDCGGACQKLCQDSFFPPKVDWSRFEKVAAGKYNLATYIENLNTAGEAVNVPYEMTAYDSQGGVILTQSGTVTLPPHRSTIAFQSAVSMGARTPTRVSFVFTDAPNWNKRTDPLSALVVEKKDYSEDDTGSSLAVTLRNSSVYPLPHMSVYAILYDADGNALGFSKTVIDEIPAESSVQAPFTWPINRNGKVISIDVLPVAE